VPERPIGGIPAVLPDLDLEDFEEGVGLFPKAAEGERAQNPRNEEVVMA
jgi:hypothetical protein